MQPLLAQLVEKLKKAHSQDLVSVMLYGSAAGPGEHDTGFSDLNILCVLREVTPAQLAKSQPVFAWWERHGRTAPLLLSEREVIGGADCFAIEFRDMQRQRQLLAGRDVIEGLHVEESFYRAQVEYELRTKLLRLRQKAAFRLADKKLLGRLLLDSVTTFCVLIRHALLLHGIDVPSSRREVLALAQDRFGMDGTTFYRLLDGREKKAMADKIRAGTLLADYLIQIEKVIDAVDRLEKPVLTVARGDV